jgi:hypothetical protein
VLYQETVAAIEAEKRRSAQVERENLQLKNKIAEMLDVMRRAVGDPSEEEQEDDMKLEALAQENENLRQLLGLSDVKA